MRIRKSGNIAEAGEGEGGHAPGNTHYIKQKKRGGTKNNMHDKTIGLVIIGSWIGAIELYALHCGINGQIMITSIGALVGVFGYFVGKRGK